MATPTTSLSAILSGEPLPMPPVQDDIEQDRFNHNLLNYLRRLNGLMTSQNINSSEDIGGDGDGVVGTVDDIEKHIEFTDGAFPAYDGRGVYIIQQYAEFDYNIDRITHIASATVGTTFRLYVNGVIRTGTGSFVCTNSEAVFTPTNGVVGIGDTVAVDIIVSGAGGTTAYAFTVKRSRLAKP